MANHRVVPLLQINPSKNTTPLIRTRRMLQKLHRHRDKLQHYREIKIINGHEFGWSRYQGYPIEPEEHLALQVSVVLHGVISLDMSSFIPDVSLIGCDSLPRILWDILPNLREINLSNTHFAFVVFSDLLQNGMHLTKITWNNIRYDSNISINGKDMRYANNLSDICMDDSIFRAGFYRKWMSDLENDEHSTFYPFHELKSSVLERVSIRNARWDDIWDDSKTDTVKIPQNALIKFVRNAPKSLRWFRSDLTHDNMNKLRSERPEIQFLN